MNSSLRKYVPDLVAAVIFLILAFAYCIPVLLGHQLQSLDDVNAISAVQETLRYNKETGDRTLWTESMFCGMPNYQIASGQYRSDRLMAPFRDFLHRGPGHTAWILIFYFISFFLLMRSFGIDRWLSIVGAIAVALSSYFIVIITAGHGGKTISISYITLTAAGFYLIFRKRYIPGAIMVMFFTAIGLATHLQMSYYLLMMTGLFYIAELWIHIRGRRWKDLGIATLVFAISLGIGAGAGSAGLFTNKEYVTETTRGGRSELAEGEMAAKAEETGMSLELATRDSYGISDTFSLLIPGIKGGSSHARVKPGSHTDKVLKARGLELSENAAPLYWGGQPFTYGNVYVGAIVCFLFLLGCLIVKGPYKWALVAATLFSVFLSWGQNFPWLTKLFFNYFPFYNKFRAVSSILIVAEIAMPLLGFLALKSVFYGSVSGNKLKRAIFVSAGITAGICLVFGIFGTSIFTFTCPNDEFYAKRLSAFVMKGVMADRASLLVSDSWRSFAFIAGTAVLLLLYINKKLPRGAAVAVLGILILFDMWPVDKRYLCDADFNRPRTARKAFSEQPWETRILSDPEPHFRVMNLCNDTFNEARTSYRLESVGGYHSAKLRRYQDVIDEYLVKQHKFTLDMLNVKYFIRNGRYGPEVQLNPDATGNAWFVKRLFVMEGARNELEALDIIDLTSTAVVEKEFAPFLAAERPGIAPDAEVRLTAFTPKRLDYECTSSQPGTIVFSEIYYPYGWKASIDGERVDHFRANYILRALNVPAGSHHITFVFDPDSARKGDTVATVCVILMYMFILCSTAYSLRRCLKTRKDASTTD